MESSDKLTYRDCLLKNLSTPEVKVNNSESTFPTPIIKPVNVDIVDQDVNLADYKHVLNIKERVESLEYKEDEVIVKTGRFPVLDSELNKIRALSSFKNNLVEHLIKYFRSHKLYNSGKLKYIRTQMYNHFPNWFFNLNNLGRIQEFLPIGPMEVQENLDYIFRENKIEKRNDFDSKLLVFNPRYIKDKLITSQIKRSERFNYIKYELVTNHGEWKLLSITRKQEANLKSRYVGVNGKFYEYVSVLLLRYKFLGGLNNHLSIPPSIYYKLGINVELFGSPFNVSVPTYCSPFPDIERYFGSQGSFSNHSLKSGMEYAANPPYDVKIVLQMAEWLEKELAREDLKDVSVYITLPLWKKDFPGYQILRDSIWFRDEAELGREDYPFLHYFRGRLIPASDTYLLILSKRTRLKWNCEQIKKLWPKIKNHYPSELDDLGTF
jgi:hypothetical protein